MSDQVDRMRPASTPLDFGPQIGRLTLVAALLCQGCLQREDPLTYPFHDADVEYYKDVAQEVAYPTVMTETADPVAFSQPPHTVRSRDITEPWDLPLMEAVHIALQNNDVIRSAGSFLSPGNQILANGQNAPSVYDPAINESGVLFGNRGVEAALSAFDATFATSMIWGRNEQIQNNPFFAGGLMPGNTLVSETGNFDASLRKDFAYGGQVQLNHSVNYLGTNAPGQLFPSTYTGMLQALYRQPLWAGAGTEYTRIAGPITQQFGGLSGVTQGVVIARINNDISIADFEAAIRNLVKDVEDTYWDLYLAYRNFDTAVESRNASLEVWQLFKIREQGGVTRRDIQEQAREQYFTAQALVEDTRSNIFTAETRLRRLLGLPVNEGRVIRPVDEPITVELVPDWQVSLTEALMHRVELRKQKWNIKSLELQLTAARSLTKPRLDFVGGYQVNGFGDNLLDYDDDDGVTAQGLSNFYETINQGNQTGWNLGFEFNLPLGFRSAHAQVRNIELRLMKAQRVLHTQELEIAHELAVAFQELARTHAAAQWHYNRRNAAIKNVTVVQAEIELGAAIPGDPYLRAIERRTRAEIDFFTAVVEYNKALNDFQFRKGTLLEDTHVTLMEDGWDPDAYIDAYRRAQARSAAIDAPHKHTEPPEFVSAAPVGSVQFAEPIEPIPAQILEEPWLEPPPVPTDRPQEEPDPAEAIVPDDPAGPVLDDEVIPTEPGEAPSGPSAAVPSAERTSRINPVGWWETSESFEADRVEHAVSVEASPQPQVQSATLKKDPWEPIERPSHTPAQTSEAGVWRAIE